MRSVARSVEGLDPSCASFCLGRANPCAFNQFRSTEISFNVDGTELGTALL